MVPLIRKLIKYVLGKDIAGETIRYIIIGGLTTLVNIGVFALMNNLIGIDVTVSNVTSIVVSVLFAYVTNKLIVFMSRCDSIGALALEFGKFIGSRLITMVLEVGVVELFYRLLGQDAWLGKAISLVLVIIANYVLSKLIVFRSFKDRAQKPEDETDNRS